MSPGELGSVAVDIALFGVACVATGWFFGFLAGSR